MTGAAAVERGRGTRIDVGDRWEGVMSDGEEASGTGRVEQDGSGALVGSETLVRGGAPWQTAGGGG